MDLAVARERLMKELDVMANRHTVLDNHLRNRDREVPTDSSERATFSENDEVLEALDDAAVNQLQAIESALRRVDDGSYGTCLQCGDTIPDGRLNAMPAATRCVGCAS